MTKSGMREYVLDYYASHTTNKVPAVAARLPHRWHLIVTQHNIPIHVPINDYHHLCQRIGEMVLSTGIQVVDVYRDGEQYRYARVSEHES